MTTQSLSDKVATFPAEQPDWDIANTLNTPNAALYGTRVVDVQVYDARSLMMTSGSWGKVSLIADGVIEPSSDAQQSLNLKALCITVRDAHLNLTLLKMTDPTMAASITGMVDSLLAAGIITQTTHDSLLALGNAPASWADINNASAHVTARDVGLARGAIA